MRLLARMYESRLFRQARYILGSRMPLYPRGHEYSALPSGKCLIQRITYPLSDIDINEDQQLRLLERIGSYYDAVPFEKWHSTGGYCFDNPYFSYSDAIICYCMIRTFGPSQIIELGSGMSTACMAETIIDADITCELMTVDRHVSRLEKIYSTGGQPDFMKVYAMDIHDIPLDEFRRLGPSDILFVDSSHVSKYGSELHRLFFEVFPVLAPGVIIHFHDVFDAFEYPESWIEEGIYWNEQYLIRAFLQGNSDYEILLFSDHMEKQYRSWYEQHMPLCLQAHERYVIGPKKGQPISEICGQSLWLRKKAAI